VTSRENTITVVVRRVVRPGRESDFEDAMRAFIAESLCFPGASDFHVVRPSTPDSREYTVVHRFIDDSARRAFVASPSYAGWMSRIRDLTESNPRIQEFSGIAGWFTLPGDAASHHAPPRLKMAIVTFLGVYPLTSLLPGAFSKALPGIHPLLVNIVTTGTIVALLTWVVMPVLTRLFRRWLFRPASPAPERAP